MSESVSTTSASIGEAVLNVSTKISTTLTLTVKPL